MIPGLSHVTLPCRDLERMAAILTGVLDAQQVCCSGDGPFPVAREKFFRIGGVRLAVMAGARSPGRSYEHRAFRVAAEDRSRYRARIARAGLQERPGRARLPGAGESLYVHDDDDHLFELHGGTLQDRLDRHARGRAA